MAESTYEEDGTSGDFLDLFCDTCFEGMGLKVKVYGYCIDCFQFMCSDCHLVHSKFPVNREHTVLHGSNMPQCKADKPPKFHYCDFHPKLLKKEFCSEHKILVCSSCSSANHNKCFIASVDNVCKTVNNFDIDSLYNDIKAFQDQARSVYSLLETNITNLAEQKKAVLEETNTIYDQIITKINKLFKDSQSNIETTYQSKEAEISQQQEKIDVLVKRFESVLTESEKIYGKSIDTKLFLKIQDIVTDTRRITDEFRVSNKSLRVLSLSFKPDKAVQDFLLPSVTFGSVSTSEGKYDKDILVKDVVFPCSPFKPPKADMVPPQQTTPPGMSGQQKQTCNSKAVGPAVPLSKIKATEQSTHSVELNDDEEHFFCVTGLAITKDRKRIMVDYNNSKVKMFSHDMKYSCSVSVPGQPWDIAVITDKEAIVTTDNNSLVTLDISGSQLSIKTTTQLSYDVFGISKYNDKLVVTSGDSNPASVKLIDQTGRVYWSVSSDQQGQPLFVLPWYVSSHGGGISSTVIVTDWSNSTLTLLNGDTGEVITRRQLKGWLFPSGVTTDTTGNVYVYYWRTDEIAVLSGDLSEEKILLSRQDGLRCPPQTIVYDEEAHQLIISYNNAWRGYYKIGVFQLS